MLNIETKIYWSPRLTFDRKADAVAKLVALSFSDRTDGFKLTTDGRQWFLKVANNL